MRYIFSYCLHYDDYDEYYIILKNCSLVISKQKNLMCLDCLYLRGVSVIIYLKGIS